VSSSPAGISCGSGCQAAFAAGSSVALTATPAAGSIFTGWTGDCTGGGSCQVTVDQARSVTATFAPNLPPHAALTIACLGLTCTFTSGSTDPDGSIMNSAWTLGDGTTGVGATISHTYAHAGSYTATLTVTDNAGATASTSKAFNPISLSARGYKQNGSGKVDLSWIGASGTSFDVYRNGTKIASTSTSTYSDSVGTKRGTFTYTVCDPAGAFCSNTATVNF
jgi:vibriolysin